MEKTDALAALAALAQETRLDIYRLLVQTGPEGLPAGQIGERLGLPSATLAFHLKELKNAKTGRLRPPRPLVDLRRRVSGHERAVVLPHRKLLRPARRRVLAGLRARRRLPLREKDMLTMSDQPFEATEIKDMVRARYGGIAAGATASCCSPAHADSAPASARVEDKAREMGYSAEDLAAVPEGANLGLGCGNPQAIAAMRPGEVVVDLGSGAGFDCLLAARQVGPGGHVIGVDMTHEMLKKARENAAKVGAANVEFRLGEIEHLPVADNTADVIISNCVINLSPDKPQVFREAFRVLKPGGRLAISDVVNMEPLTPDLAADPDAGVRLRGGAAPAWKSRHGSGAGFVDIRVSVKPESRDIVQDWAPGRGIEDSSPRRSSRRASRHRVKPAVPQPVAREPVAREPHATPAVSRGRAGHAEERAS